MGFLDVHANPDPASRSRVPLLLDVQSDLLSGLSSRVVVPLYREKSIGGGAMARLTPVLAFQGQDYVAMVPELSGISRQALGTPLGTLSGARHDLVSALDLLFTGI